MGTHVGATASSATAGQPVLTWASLGSYIAGDVAVMVVFHSNTTTVTTPSGWTKIGGAGTSTGNIPGVNSVYAEVYTKTLAGTESGTLTIATTSAGKVNQVTYVRRGVNQPTSAEIASTGTGTDTTQSQAVPALSHSGNLDWITFTSTRNSTPPTTFTNPAGTTMGASTFTTGGGANCAAVAYANASESDGSVGSGNWAHNTAVAVDWVTLTVALVNAVTRITKTQSTTWQVRSRVTKTQSTSWNVLARLAKTLTTSWEVRQRVTKTQGTTWNVAGSLTRITKTIVASWDVRSRVTKTQSTTWNVLAALARITKTISTSWDVRARVAKTQGTTWSVRSRLAKTLATTWNVRSMISEASWPAFIGHRGTDPGPEETMFAYDALYARSPNYWHEGDGQALNDGTTMVANHDDTVDRMYSSGPVATGNVTAISPTNWALEKWRPNTGFTGPDQFALRLLDWVAKYGFNPTAGPAIGLWEVKTGTSAAQMGATFANCKGTVILNCNSLVDAQTVRAAGFDACYQTDTPNFATDFTPNGIKYLSINYTAMTGTIASQAIAAGVKVLMYTVNSTANRDSMLALFSDSSYAGFISNKPQTLAGTTRITKTTSTTWSVRARVAKTLSTTWNVRARLAKTQATSWDVRARVAKAIATTWNVRQRVTKTQSTTWDVASGATTSRARVWNGTAWVAKPVKVGVTWVTKTLKARSGGTWI